MNARAVQTSALRSLASETFVAAGRHLSGSRIIPLLIVSLFAGIMAYTQYITTESAVMHKFGEPPDWADALIVIQCMAGFCTQLIVWVLCAATAHLMAVILDGAGKFIDLFFYWGYGYFPLVLGALFILKVFAASLDTVAVLAITANQNIDAVPEMVTAQIIGRLGMVLLAAWGIFSVGRIHGLTFIKSTLCLAIPLLSLLLLRLLFLAIV